MKNFRYLALITFVGMIFGGSIQAGLENEEELRKVSFLNCLMERLFNHLESDYANRLTGVGVGVGAVWFLRNTLKGMAQAARKRASDFLTGITKTSTATILAGSVLAGIALVTTYTKFNQKNKKIRSNIRKIITNDLRIFNGSNSKEQKNALVMPKIIAALSINNIKQALLLAETGHGGSWWYPGLPDYTYNLFIDNDCENLAQNLMVEITKLNFDISYSNAEILCAIKADIEKMINSNEENQKTLEENQKTLNYYLSNTENWLSLKKLLVNTAESLKSKKPKQDESYFKCWKKGTIFERGINCQPLTLDLFKTPKYQDAFFDFVFSQYIDNREEGYGEESTEIPAKEINLRLSK